MKELFQSIFDSSNDRIKNPFIGSFATAFIIFNWRPIFLLLFSDAIIEDKIVVINHEYCNPSAIIIPIIIAVLYIVVLPYINLGFDSILSYSNNKKKEREKASVLNALTHKKSEAKLEREIAEELAGTSEINNLKDQIERLNTENFHLSEQNKEAFERYSKSIEMAKKQEENMNNIVLDLDKDNIKKNDYIQLLGRSLLNEFTEEEIQYFIQFASSNQNNKSVKRNDVLINKFLEKNMLIFNSKNLIYEFSPLGNVLYEYLLKPPF